MTELERAPRVLLCADPLMHGEPDSTFALEVEAIVELAWPFDLLDFESLLAGDASRATRRLDGGAYLYRGWMIPAARYEALATAIAQRGGSMITSPPAYIAAHHLPQVYPAIEAMTPKTTWIDGSPPYDPGAIREALAPFGDKAVIVKDFVKSRKHEWIEACFIPSATQTSAVERVVSRFIDLQGDDLAGGLVFREFIDLDPVGRHPQSGLLMGREYRLFFVDGRLLIGGRYWDGVDYIDEYPLEPFEAVAARIPSRFFSMDIAKTAAGDWIVLEVGDGQVSGLPGAIDPHDFYRRLQADLARPRGDASRPDSAELATPLPGQ